uniref:GH23462p n=1 Tax=Drosophila melanogaster TaxID=7227 RepID=Q95T45_DROME|nr:GH23462p [Drosophila melanogaster]
MKRGHRAFISVSLGSALHFSPAPLPHSCSQSLSLLRWHSVGKWKSRKSGKKENQWQPDRDRVIKRSHSELLMKAMVRGDLLRIPRGKWAENGGCGLHFTCHCTHCGRKGWQDVERTEKDRFEALITWSLIALIIFHFAPAPLDTLPSGFQFPSISIFASFAFRLFLVSRFPILLSCFLRLGIFNLQPVVPEG